MTIEAASPKTFDNALIRVDKLVFERWFIPIFEALSFTVTRAEILLVRGSNGSGKTTLLRLLAGLLQPTEGQVIMPQLPIAWLGHKLGIKDSLSVRENLQFLARFYGHEPTPDLLANSIEQVDLNRVADQDAGSLSAGQRKRCALAALLFQPQAIWLLDEPYSNLDEHGVRIVDNLLAAHQQRGGISVLASHGALSPRNLDVRELIIHSYQESQQYRENLA